MGLKVRLTLQVLPIASVAPQVVEVIAKPVLGTTLVISSVAVPVFFSVTDLGVLMVSTATLPKAREVGVRVTDLTGEICTRWNERESTWRKSGSCQSRGTNQSKS